MAETPELERLRARVAELEAARGATSASSAGTPRPQRRTVRWSMASAILLTLACVLAPLSVASVWASTVLSDTDRYVAAVAPLAADPAVKDALAGTVTTTVVSAIGVEEFTRGAPEAIAGPINSRLQSYTRDQVDALFASPRFPELWAEVNRVGHRQVVALLEGDPDGTLSAQEGAITVNVGPIVGVLRRVLVDRGFGWARAIPVVDRSFVLAESDVITRGQDFYRLLNKLGAWLPVAAMALLAAGVVLARDRRKAIVGVGLGVAASMLALGIGLTLLRGSFVGGTAADVVSPHVAGAYFDALTRVVWTWLRALGVLGLVVALGCWVAGPSVPARRARGALRELVSRARGQAPSAGGRARLGSLVSSRAEPVKTLRWAGDPRHLVLSQNVSFSCAQRSKPPGLKGSR